MRVFLCYPSELRANAEKTYHRLLGAGYGVFWDEKSLAPGDHFDTEIARLVAKCDAAVVLVSVASARNDRYWLREVALIERRWPSAKGRVIPVLTVGCEAEALPPYLAAVTALRPQGDETAAIVDAVDQMRARIAQGFRRRVAIAAIAAAAIVSAGSAAVAALLVRDASPHAAKEAALVSLDAAARRGDLAATLKVLDADAALEEFANDDGQGAAHVVCKHIGAYSASESVAAVFELVVRGHEIGEHVKDRRGIHPAFWLARDHQVRGSKAFSIYVQTAFNPGFRKPCDGTLSVQSGRLTAAGCCKDAAAHGAAVRTHQRADSTVVLFEDGTVHSFPIAK